MPVRCPPCQWPAALEERGPPEDASILLTAAARFGDAAMQIVAIRINTELRWAPDYKPEVAAAAYQANGFDAMLETVLEELENVGAAFGELLGESRSSILELPPGRYRVAILPAAFGA